MTREEIKKLLNSYKDQLSKVHLLGAIYRNRLNELVRAPIVGYDSVRVSSSASTTSPQELYVMRYETAKENYEAASEELFAIENRISKLCEVLSAEDREFVTEMYIEIKPTYKVECEKGLTSETLRKKRQRIIKRLEKRH